MDSKRAKSRLNLSVSALAVATVLSFGSAQAATTTSNLQGNAGAAAAGAVVTATNVDTGETGKAKVAADGNYVIVGLTPGRYHVQLGDKTKDAALPVNETVYVDFNDAAGAVREVVVTGHRQPGVDVRATSIATVVSQVQIENLPQYDRNFLNFAALAPGVLVTPPGSNVTFSSDATNSDNVNVFIDGESFKGQVGHGGVAGQNFSQGNPFPQLAVEQYKVETQNFKAEYDQAGGAVINAVTKSGTNEFHGDAYFDDVPQRWYGVPYFSRGGSTPAFDREQYGADLGGPIIKDKLFFFVAVEGTQQDVPATAVNLFQGTNFGTNTQAAANAAAVEKQYNGLYATNFTQRLYFGKLTWLATDHDKVDLTLFYRDEGNRADFGGTRVPSAGHNLSNPMEDFQLQWRHRGENWQNELSLSYQDANTSTPDLTGGPEIDLTFGQNTGAQGAQLGAHYFTQTSAQREYNFRDYVTYTGWHWAGNHVIKAGFKNDYLTETRNYSEYANGAFYYDITDYTGAGSTTPYAAQIALNPSRPAPLKDDQLGLFIQDDWTYGDHWTFNYGVRWDYETNQNNNNYVTPAVIANELLNYEPWQAAGINPHDYISTGHNRQSDPTEFAPRLGASYDWNGDRDLVFFAGWGRYYDRFLALEAGTETVTNAYQSNRVVTFGTGPGQIPFQSSYLTNPQALASAVLATLPPACDANGCGSVFLLDNKVKTPYTDEFDIGVRKKFGAIQTSISYVHSMSYNIFQFVRGNRLPDGSYPSYNGQYLTYDNFPACGQLGWNGLGWTPGAPGNAGNCGAGATSVYNGKIDIGESNGKTRYDAVFITVDKPFTNASKWGAGATMTIGHAQSNDVAGVENLGSVVDDEAYEGPSQTYAGWSNSPGVPKFNFVAWAIVQGPWETKFSANLNLNSGPAFGTYGCGAGGCIGNYNGLNFPRDKLAYQDLDLRVSKDFVLYSHYKLGAYFQVFNVFDHVNRTYSAWGAGSSPTLEENGTVGLARTFQAGGKFSF